MFNTASYQKHTEFANNYSGDAYLASLFDEASPIFYYNSLFFKNLGPLIAKNDTWLTVGDFTGIDAAYIKKNGGIATGTDLTISELEKLKKKGLIDECFVQNVEAMTFTDDTFDFVCCKEAYHHFPRPSIGFYEMLRVAKKGVVILEPTDLNMAFPLLMFVRNILDRFNTSLLKKLWKNQYSYETVGNFVYKISFREFEKKAVALDLPFMASKGFNSNMNARQQSRLMQNIKRRMVDFFCKLSLIPYQHLAIVVFKTTPTEKEMSKLQQAGYLLHSLPKNPYI